MTEKVEAEIELTIAKFFKQRVHYQVRAYPEVGKERGVGQCENR